MLFRQLLLCAGAALPLFAAAPASSATLVVNGSGQLTGATGVTVLGVNYDVEFLDGTFNTVFNNGDTLTGLPFLQGAQPAQAAGASAAAQALLDQVFIGTFDDNPSLTFGCSNPTRCIVAVPYAFDPSNILTFSASNFNASASTPDFASGFALFRTIDTSVGFPELTFARFSVAQVTPPPVGAVPEPATWAMMLLGFFGIGGAMRSRQKFPLPSQTFGA